MKIVCDKCKSDIPDDGLSIVVCGQCNNRQKIVRKIPKTKSKKKMIIDEDKTDEIILEPKVDIISEPKEIIQFLDAHKKGN